MAHLKLHSFFQEGENRMKSNFHRNSVIQIIPKLDNLQVPTKFDVFSSLSEEDSSELMSEHIKYEKSTTDLKAKISNLKEQRCLKLQYSLKLFDSLIILLSLSGLLSEIYNYENNYTGVRGGQGEKYKSTKMNDLIKVITSITTILSLIISIFRSLTAYYLKRERKYLFKDKLKPYFNSSSFKTLAVDWAILIIHPPPFYDIELKFEQLHGVLYLDLSAVCLSLMMFRFLFLFRIFLHYSKWSSLKVQKICREHGVGHPLRFALKACLKDRPYFLLIPVFAISTFSLGVALEIYEQPFNEDNTEYADNGNKLDYSYLYNAMWLILLTMTTVGFGDFYARTHVGRFISIIAAMWGTFLISLMIIMFNNYVLFSRQQEKSFKYFRKISAYKQVKDLATELIGAVVYIHVLDKYRGVPRNDPIYRDLRRKVLHCRTKFRLAMNEVKFKDESIRDELLKVNDFVGLDFMKLDKMLSTAKDTDLQLDSILESQKKVLDTILHCLKFSKECRQMVELYP